MQEKKSRKEVTVGREEGRRKKSRGSPTNERLKVPRGKKKKSVAVAVKGGGEIVQSTDTSSRGRAEKKRKGEEEDTSI